MVSEGNLAQSGAPQGEEQQPRGFQNGLKASRSLPDTGASPPAGPEWRQLSSTSVCACVCVWGVGGTLPTPLRTRSPPAAVTGLRRARPAPFITAPAVAVRRTARRAPGGECAAPLRARAAGLRPLRAAARPPPRKQQCTTGEGWRPHAAGGDAGRRPRDPHARPHTHTPPRPNPGGSGSAERPAGA